MLFALFFFLFPVISPSAEEPPLELSCVTDWPTTSFLVWTEGKEVLARVIHHNGAEYAPAISGIYTPRDLPILAERAALAQKMGRDMTFRWPRENCQKTGEMLIRCFHSGDEQKGEGGAKILPFALYSTAHTQEGIAGHQEFHTVSLSFDVDGKSGALIEMRYQKGECVPKRLEKSLKAL